MALSIISVVSLGIHRLRAFLAELRRRRVFRVAACYSAAAYLVVQVANNFFPPLHLPGWSTTLVAALAVLGLPIAVVLAWAFEITPEGIRQDEGAGEDERTAGYQGAGSRPDLDVSDRAVGRVPASRSLGGKLSWSAVVLVLLAGGVWMGLERLGTAEEADPGAVAVLPFALSGGADYAYLATGIVDLLSRNLDAPGFRSVDAGRVLRATAAPDGKELNPEAALEVARGLGAGAFVTGTIHHTPGQLRLHASLYEARGGEAGETVARASVEGEPERLFDLVDRLSAQLLAHRRSGAVSGRLSRSAALTTGSLEAFRAYLEAEQAFRVADMPAAIAGYRRAIGEDPDFALAHYRLASAYWWSEPRPEVDRTQLFERSREAAERAAALGDRLSDRDRLLVEAFLALHRGHPDLAEERYRSFLVEYPDDVEARFQLADLLHHYNAPRGRPLAEAGDHFRLVLEADPEFACPI